MNQDDFEKESSLFCSIIENQVAANNQVFWKQNAKNLPKLAKLATQVFNIPATSAHLEGFFSITGFINHCKTQRMSEQLLAARSMLKVNMKILENKTTE